MSAINVTHVAVLDNPSPFSSPFQFEIAYECLRALSEDLEWKLIYVGSAEDEKYDQVLESVLVGPLSIGTFRFVFQADPPDPSKIPNDDILGVTVLLLTCAYREREFLRVGYYVNNEYADADLREEPPATVLISRVQRNILADKPRVTRFPIPWDADLLQQQQQQQQEEEEQQREQLDDGEEPGGQPPAPSHGLGEAAFPPPEEEGTAARPSGRAPDDAYGPSSAATSSLSYPYAPPLETAAMADHRGYEEDAPLAEGDTDYPTAHGAGGPGDAGDGGARLYAPSRAAGQLPDLAGAGRQWGTGAVL